MLNPVSLFLLLVAAPLIALIACGPESPSPRVDTEAADPISTSDIEAYADQSKILLSSSGALQDWTKNVDGPVLLDLSKLDRPHIATQYKAAWLVYTTSRDALTEYRLIVPPLWCQEIHRITTEALRLQERAFLQMKTYLELGLKGRDAPDRLSEANKLMEERDTVILSAMTAFKQCFGE